MGMHGRNNGKKLMTVRIVKHAFEIIFLMTGENPLQVVVNAIINSGPREDSTRIEELELSGVRLLMCLLSGGSIRPSGCCALGPGRQLSGTSSPSLNVSLTSSSTLLRVPPTATQSRRRTNWSVWPSPTDKHRSKMVLAGFLGVEQESSSN